MILWSVLTTHFTGDDPPTSTVVLPPELDPGMSPALRSHGWINTHHRVTQENPRILPWSCQTTRKGSSGERSESWGWLGSTMWSVVRLSTTNIKRSTSGQEEVGFYSILWQVNKLHRQSSHLGSWHAHWRVIYSPSQTRKAQMLRALSAKIVCVCVSVTIDTLMYESVPQ